MIDLLQAAQDGVFAALKPIEAADGMPKGLKVFQHVPENTKSHYVMVGAMGSESADEHGDQVEMITVEVVSVYHGAGRAPLLAIMHEVRAALDAEDLAAEGVAFEPPRYQRAGAGDVLEDGVTYVGLSYFEFTAEPA